MAISSLVTNECQEQQNLLYGFHKKITKFLFSTFVSFVGTNHTRRVVQQILKILNTPNVRGSFLLQKCFKLCAKRASERHSSSILSVNSQLVPSE